MTLKQIEKKLEIEKNKWKKAGKEIGKLQGEKLKIALKEIKERGLNESPWFVDLDYQNNISLIEDIEENMPILNDLCKEFSNYMCHYDVTLDNKHCVRIDDHEVSIHFKDLNDCVKFVKKYKIQVDLSRIENEMREFNNKVEKLDEIRSAFKNIK